jgi:transcriptional regulator GlxA family with amidase domain
MSLDTSLTDPRFVAEIKRLAAPARRTCSDCTGAFALAAAGLLDGRRATTHWAFSHELQRRYPAVHLEPDRIYVRDGPITTSAGVTAGIDLALALVEEDHGSELARTIARWIVAFLQRPGGQAQFSERLALPAEIASPLRTVLDLVVADPAGDHRQAQLARRASVSERHLRRLFAQQTHTTPARFVERIRVEAARNLLETTTPPSTRSRYAAASALAKRCAARSSAPSARPPPSTETASDPRARSDSPRDLAANVAAVACPARLCGWKPGVLSG